MCCAKELLAVLHVISIQRVHTLFCAAVGASAVAAAAIFVGIADAR